ncbi:hypothetical protein BPOR_0991g00030 [Botrytis porri]|uniref:Uncharacterized protein n=1 Tax=Botrytis porri TaxID=87229 RepID=A0A4Z1KKA4_9HELO|nr:hypothetical protein BPOR_0991g00030 [Botrytis porri]
MLPTIVLITGANRRLGKGLLERFLALPNHIVIAATRDTSHKISKKLADLPKGSGSGLIVVKIDDSIEQDAFDVVQELQDQHNIQHIDIVITNVGVSMTFVAKIKGSYFTPVGSPAGAIAHQPPIRNAAYGPTKAAVNWLTVRIHVKNDWLNAVVMVPGWVATELGYEGAKGLDKSNMIHN